MKSVYMLEGEAMKFVVDGFSQRDLDHMRSVIEAVREQWKGESDQRILMMALNRLYLDVVQPPIAEEYPTRDELRDMNGGRDPIPVTEEHRKLAGKGIRAFLERARSAA
jgi:hypothetical protein